MTPRSPLGTPHDKPVYVRLQEIIADGILSGEYGDGDPLPSVRAFAAEQQANPLTVAKAYQGFQDEGLIVVKRGVEGATSYDSAGTCAVPAFPVEEVDPTGAGDTFGAAYVTFWLRDLPPRDALTLASAAGALAVRKRGPMEGTSTPAELDAFLDAQTSKVLP